MSTLNPLIDDAKRRDRERLSEARNLSERAASNPLSRFGKHASRRNFALGTGCRFAGAMRPKTQCSIFGAFLQAIVTATRLNGGLSDRAANPVVSSHWRMLQERFPSLMEWFWRWPENDSSGSFYDVPMCESNDSKSGFQPQGGLPATLWPGAMPRRKTFLKTDTYFLSNKCACISR